MITAPSRRHPAPVFMFFQSYLHAYGRHYSDVIMSAIAFQVISFTIVYSTICSGTVQRKHQSSAPMVFVGEFTGDRWIPRTKASDAENVSIWWRHHVTYWLVCSRCRVHSIKHAPDFKTLRPRQNCRHFADDIFKCIFLNKNVWISPKISLTFVPTVRINTIPSLVQITAWRRPGDKPLSEPTMVKITDTCMRHVASMS